jgi:hypothetical protein
MGNEMDIVNIYNFCYEMELRGGGDVWRCRGNAENHPNFPSGAVVYPSTPVMFNEEKLEFTTASGRQYRILSFGAPSDKVIEQLKKDIAEGGFEIH